MIWFGQWRNIFIIASRLVRSLTWVYCINNLPRSLLCLNCLEYIFSYKKINHKLQLFLSFNSSLLVQLWNAHSWDSPICYLSLALRHLWTRVLSQDFKADVTAYYCIFFYLGYSFNDIVLFWLSPLPDSGIVGKI